MVDTGSHFLGKDKTILKSEFPQIKENGNRQSYGGSGHSDQLTPNDS